MGVAAGFDLLGSVLTTPEAGLFSQTAATGTGANAQRWVQFNDEHPQPGAPLMSGAAGNYQSIGLIDGKYSTQTWDFTNCGYYWDEECQTRIGYLIDKEIALDELSQSIAEFTGFDTSADVRQYAIGYVVPFKSQIEEKLGAILAGDYQSVAPYFAKTGSTYSVQQPSWTLDNPALPKADIGDPLTGIIDPSATSPYSSTPASTRWPPSRSDVQSDVHQLTLQIFVIGNGSSRFPTRRSSLSERPTPRSSSPTAEPRSGSCTPTRTLIRRTPRRLSAAARPTALTRSRRFPS